MDCPVGLGRFTALRVATRFGLENSTYEGMDRHRTEEGTSCVHYIGCYCDGTVALVDMTIEVDGMIYEIALRRVNKPRETKKNRTMEATWQKTVIKYNTSTQ